MKTASLLGPGLMKGQNATASVITLPASRNGAQGEATSEQLPSVLHESSSHPRSSNEIDEGWAMNTLKKLEEEVGSWPNVSVHPHRFGGREFLLGAAEVGHVHTGGIVDIPLPRSVRDALLEDGLAEEHHWVPNSGWITFRIRSEEDLPHAVWLMRISYLRYALKLASDPRKMLEREIEELHLSLRFTSLLEPFVRKTAGQVA